MLEALKKLYIKIFRIHDTPQKIALGLGLGVFTGLVPTIGPLTALFLAFIFRANRASALLGSLLTNTWLSLLTLLLSIKVGSVIMRVEWLEVYKNWGLVLKDFHWAHLFKLSIFKIILPVIVGYLAIALCLGLLTYLAALIILNLRKERNAHKNRT